MTVLCSPSCCNRNAAQLTACENSESARAVCNVWGRATYETYAGEVTVSGGQGQSYISGQSDVFGLLRDLIDLHKEGIHPELATWFYYGHDWSRDADEEFLFFVAHGGKIVRERFSIMHTAPRVLAQYKVDDEPLWHAEPY